MYKVLIVDDEALPREFLKLQISGMDQYEIVGEASDGQEALDFIRDHQIHLVITDIKMPVMNGLELCKHISANYPSIKTVILTGYEEFQFAKEAMMYNAQDYLLKPIANAELIALMNRLAHVLEQEHNREMAYHAMQTMSNEAKQHIAQRFIKALINDHYTEINTLYPLVHRLKLSLLEGVGTIMILSVDTSSLLEKSIPYSDISVYKYILYQLTAEVVEPYPQAWTLLDEEENTVLLLSNTDRQGLTNLCTEIYSRLGVLVNEHTKLRLIGSIGEEVTDVLQVQTAYHTAHISQQTSSLRDEERLSRYTAESLSRYHELTSLINAVRSGLLNANPVSYTQGLKSYISQITPLQPDQVARYCHLMLKHISSDQVGTSRKQVELAWELLRQQIYSAQKMETGELLRSFKSIAALFLSEKPDHDDMKLDEQDNLIEQIKNYIYDHYSEPISLSQIADEFNISTPYLSQLFHKKVGETYVKFLTGIRMERAAMFLTTTRKKVFEISEMVGYVNPKHFAYVFKQHYGVTPGEFQASHTKS